MLRIILGFLQYFGNFRIDDDEGGYHDDDGGDVEGGLYLCWCQLREGVKEKNIARGTTDPGYWFYNLSYLFC